MPLTYLLAGIALYIILGRFVVSCLRGWVRDAVFAVMNTAGVYYFLFYGHNVNSGVRFAAYLALVAFQYVLLRLFATKGGVLPWLAFFVPILALVVIRYVPASVYTHFNGAFGMHWRGNPDFVGISYFAFRCSYLVIEVRNGTVKRPSFWQYLGFCFFVPTMQVGPINPYGNHSKAFDPEPPSIPVGRACMRLLVGLVKYTFLGAILNRLTYSGLLLDDHPHHWIDLPIAAVFYYLFLYCNFSGFCDAAVGAAGLMGIPVAENFNNPFAARNMKEFWNRWHITLSHYMRDVVFTPLSKYLVGVMGPKNVNHAIGITIAVVFLLIGIWHGVGWNFVAYGIVQAIGVVSNHYYTIWLKKCLGRDGFKAYNANPWIHAAAVIVTFCYSALSLMLFANTFPKIQTIFSTLVK